MATPRKDPRRTTDGGAGALGAWSAVAAALAAATVAYTASGVRPGSDVPSLAAGVCALVALVPAIRAAVRDDAGRRVLAWRGAGPLLAFTLVLLLAAAASPHRATALLGAPASGMGAVACIALAGIVYGAALRARPLRAALALALPVLFVVQLALAAVAVAGGGEPQGTVANSSYMGQLVVLALPATALAVAARMRVRFAGPVVALVAGAALLVAGSFAAGAAALLYGVWLLSGAVPLGGGGERPRVPVRAAIVLGTAAVSGLAAYLAVPALLTTVDRRVMLWTASLRLWFTSPLLGVGPDAFRPALAAVASPGLLERGTDGSLLTSFSQLAIDPHAVVLWSLVSTGLLGLGVTLWCVTVAAGHLRDQMRAGDDGAAPLAAGVLLYAVTTLVAPAPLQTAALAALVLGAALRPRADAPVPRGVGAAMLAAGALAGVLVAGSGAVGLAVATGPAPTTADAARARAGAAVVAIDPFLHHHAGIVADTAGERRGADAPGLASLEAAVRLAPYDPFYALEHARTLAYHGVGRERCAPAFRRAVELFPNSYEALADAAGYLASTGDPADREAARGYAVRATRIDPAHPVRVP